MRKTEVRDDPRLRKIDKSIGWAVMIVGFTPILIGLVVLGVTLGMTWDDQVREFKASFEMTWPDAGALSLMIIWMYWLLSIVAKGALLIRSTLFEVCAELIAKGINPAQTIPAKSQRNN